MTFKELKDMPDGEPICSSDKYYDFFDGGYIEPESFSNDEEYISKVNEARATILEFFETIESHGLFEEM